MTEIISNPYIQASLLGIIQGLTEFLPVSSTGHLILFGEVLHFVQPVSKTFDVVIQFGSILAVCVVYFQRFAGMTVGLTRDPSARHFALVILIAFLPAMVVGGLFHGYIKSHLFTPVVVSIALILGGVVLLVIERFVPCTVHEGIERMPYRIALGIGLFQCLALVPGTSRSGATIIGALLMKVERRVAVEFSFFLAVPTMIAATTYELYKARGDLTMDGGLLIAIGFVLAFLSSLVVVRTLIAFVSRFGFSAFGWYRIILGSLMLVYL
ncbi:MAG: undecaprenyl-diphosphate phosphatase [Rhodospirillaceae bacterium]